MRDATCPNKTRGRERYVRTNTGSDATHVGDKSTISSVGQDMIVVLMKDTVVADGLRTARRGL